MTQIVSLARDESRKILNALTPLLEGSQRIFVAYGPYTRGLARFFRLALKLSNPQLSVEIVDSDSYPSMELPYVSEYVDALIAFLRAGSRIHRVATVARLLQVKAIAVVPKLPEVVRRALRGFNAIEVEDSVYSLSIVLAALEIASKSKEARASRVSGELAIDSELVEDVKRRFSTVSSSLGSSTIVCSSATEAMCDEVKARGYAARHLHEALAACESSIVLAYASCEDQVASEFVLNYRRKCPNAKISGVRVNTDPLTAPLYLLLSLL